MIGAYLASGHPNELHVPNFIEHPFTRGHRWVYVDLLFSLAALVFAFSYWDDSDPRMREEAKGACLLGGAMIVLNILWYFSGP
jgi:hypothetical protein